MPLRFVRLCVVLLSLLTAGFCSSCAPAPGTDHSHSDPRPPAVTSPPPDPSATIPPDEALRTYYETRIEELEQSLAAVRQDLFATRTAYEARLDELRRRLAAYESAFVPETVHPLPETTPPAETAPPDPPARPQLFEYHMENGHAVIDRYRGRAAAVTVPASIEGRPVTMIADSAFARTMVESVILPPSVTTVGWFAFSECHVLRSVTLPPSVSTIGYGAFDGCPAVTLICVPRSYAHQYAVSFCLPVRHPN